MQWSLGEWVGYRLFWERGKIAERRVDSFSNRCGLLLGTLHQCFLLVLGCSQRRLELYRLRDTQLMMSLTTHIDGSIKMLIPTTVVKHADTQPQEGQNGSACSALSSPCSPSTLDLAATHTRGRSPCSP